MTTTLSHDTLRVESRRGATVESVHRVSAAVVDADGRLVASAGDPDFRTFLRSAAKPFQAMPLVEDGVVEHFAITSEELALTCASHNGQANQVAIVRGLLERIGCTEADLACGPHRSLMDDLGIPDDGAPPLVPDALPRTSITSNCSGKHTGMLALARHHGWPVQDYHKAGHPVQKRCKAAVAAWTETAPSEIGEGVDGCAVVCFALPMRAVARGYARLATSDGAPRSIVNAMSAHPDLVAGRGRLCTALMQAVPTVLAKVGAEGVYGAALLDKGLGIALKVEDGHTKAAGVALLAVLDQLGVTPPPSARLKRFAELPIANTRGENVGVVRAAGSLAFV